MPVKIFFCYAREDESLLKKLEAHLKPLQRQGLIDVWHDRDISAGTEWEPEIKKHLNSADIILLLVSPDFMNSDYCYIVEVKRALERHERGEVRVIPVIVRPVYWQGELGKFQVLPTDAAPITTWKNTDEAFLNVAEGIRTAIEELTAAGNAQDEARRNDEQSRTYHANLAKPTHSSKAKPPSSGSQQEFRGKRIYIVLSLGLLPLLILAGVFGYFLFSSSNAEKIRHSQAVVPSEENIITKAQDGEYIGISNGRFAFDTQRPDGQLKIQAAEKLQANDVGSADSLWQQAVTQDTNDAETLIYMEDQRILDGGNPYITIVVGTTLSRDPIAMAAGREATQAAYVAQREYNTASTLPGGVKIRLLIASSGKEYPYATTVAQQIVQLARQKDSHIVAVMGWTSTATTLNVIATLSSAKIPMVTNSGGDLLSGRSPYFFRVVPPASVQGQLGAMYAERRFHARTAAVFFDKNHDFMLSLKDGFKSRFTGDGNTIVATELYTVGEPGPLPQLLDDALSKHPDILYFAGYSGDVGVILAHLQPSDPPVVGGSSLYQLAFPKAQSGLTHLSFTATGYPDEWDSLGLKKPRFFTDYKADFDPNNQHANSPYGYDRPDGPTMEVFDAISVLLYGCSIALSERSPLTGSGLQHALTEVNGAHPFQGVSSQISFDSNGNAIDRAIVFVCVKGQNFKIDGIYGKLVAGEAYQTQIFTPSACK